MPMRVLFPPARMKAVMAGTAMGMGGSYSGKSDGGDRRLPEKVAELAFADAQIRKLPLLREHYLGASFG